MELGKMIFNRLDEYGNYRGYFHAKACLYFRKNIQDNENIFNANRILYKIIMNVS